MTIVPLELYFNPRGIAKLKLAVAEGKKLHDKREDAKKRDWNREKARLMREKGMSAPAWPYPAPADDGGARHLVPGLALPDLPLPSTHAAPVNLFARHRRVDRLRVPVGGRPGSPIRRAGTRSPARTGRRRRPKGSATFNASSKPAAWTCSG